MNNATILVIDDNAPVLASLELYLKQKFDRIICLKKPDQLVSLLNQEAVDVVLLDMNFSAGISTGNEGLYWLKRIQETAPHLPVILITAYGDVELAVRAIKEGATDFILKPWDNNKLYATLVAAIRLKRSETALQKLQMHLDREKEDFQREFSLVKSESEGMRKVFDLVARVADTNANVLITGENGTGKELVAREIHARSSRRQQIFCKVDLGSLAPTLFESEMFGHVKGAFTDAKESRTGRFENADGGTLFLDEIGNLTLPLQSKLLTAIETGKITPLGSPRDISVNVRLLCATNADPAALVNEGLFREDLLYRINTITIHIPPLRERDGDILLLAQAFLEEFADKYRKSGASFHPAALDAMLAHPWPGNVRELRHAVERAVILCGNNTIAPGDLFTAGKQPAAERKGRLSLEETEKLTIREALEHHHYNMTETARELKIGRQTLYRKIARYGLT